MCVSVGCGRKGGNETFHSSFWEMVVLPGVCEFSDLNVEGEMGYMFLVRLYVLSIWQEQSILLRLWLPELMVLSELCEWTSQ